MRERVNYERMQAPLLLVLAEARVECRHDLHERRRKGMQIVVRAADTLTETKIRAILFGLFKQPHRLCVLIKILQGQRGFRRISLIFLTFSSKEPFNRRMR